MTHSGRVLHGIARAGKKEEGRERDMSLYDDDEYNVRVIIERACAEFCDKYCKWPEKWDADKEGMELCESEHCANCPTQRLC